jgi:hypothetical protein
VPFLSKLTVLTLVTLPLYRLTVTVTLLVTVVFLI